MEVLYFFVCISKFEAGRSIETCGIGNQQKPYLVFASEIKMIILTLYDESFAIQNLENLYKSLKS